MSKHYKHWRIFYFTKNGKLIQSNVTDQAVSSFSK